MRTLNDSMGFAHYKLMLQDIAVITKSFINLHSFSVATAITTVYY